MTALDFARCEPVTLVYEGGYANNRRDPGGITLEGITQRVYNAYCDRIGKPRKPLIAAMRGTPEWIADRDAIYRAQYWNAVRGDELPEGVNIVLFDGAVHSGPYQSAIWLQRALQMNDCDCDGHIGEGTLAALQAHPDHVALVADICSRRLGMMQHLETWPDFRDGWTRRVANLKQIGQAWAADDHQSAPSGLPVHEEGGNAKAYASDVAQPAIDAGDAVKAGVGSGSVTGVLEGVKDQVAPLAYSSGLMMKLYTGIAIICALAGIGALFYSIWANRKTNKARRAIAGDIMADVPEGQPA